MATNTSGGQRGRGALSNRAGRYESLARESFDDGWGTGEDGVPVLRTTLERDTSRRVITYNDSPDIPFDRSLNPYRGCEHGCVYCYARPTHAWLGLSPGLDFESRLFYKADAAQRLREELARPSYRCAPVALGANTDPYQPVERRQRVTRSVLEVLSECEHPVSVVTKSALIERDAELLADMARRRLAKVAISVTTLDREIARGMEPRAPAPRRRLAAIEKLADLGVPVSVLVAPVVPVLTDGELEAILAAAREAGAGSASYILLRLPLELKELVEEWLQEHHPLAAKHVLARLRDAREGRLYQSAFGQRQTGNGQYAELLAQRFALACRKLGLGDEPELDTTRFRRPSGRQLALF